MRYLLFALLFFAVSCNRTGKKPEELSSPAIPRDTMVQVLADIHLLEAALVVRSPQQRITSPMPHAPGAPVAPPPVTEKKTVPLDYYNVLQKHGVTFEQYENALSWYTSHPDILQGVYDDVVTELTKRQTKEQTGK